MKMTTKTKTSNIWSPVLASLLLPALLIGCGKHEKNPVKNYESLDKKVAPYKKDTKTHETKIAVYNVDYEGSLKFIQGEGKTILFRPRLAFTEPEKVKFDLLMTQGPMAEGAKFVNNGNGTWTLSWKPKTNTLTTSESSRIYPLQIRFVLLDSSSALSKKQFAGVHPMTEFEMELLKDASEPIIEDDVRVSPGATLNSDQNAEIKFIAAAAGLDKLDSLQVNVVAGPSTPSNELARMDGQFATSQRAVLVSNEGIDASGRQRQLFKIDFNAKEFAAAAIEEIQKIPSLKNKYDKGELTSAEAVFSIEAFNRYNSRRSSEKIISLTVNLTDKPGAVEFATQTGFTLATGANAQENFYLRSAGNRGVIAISKITLGDQTAEFKAGKAQVALNGVTTTLTCQLKGNDMDNKTFGCANGQCYKNCVLSVVAACDAKQGTQTLVLSANSKLGAEEVQSDLNYAFTVKGNTTGCQQPAPATQQGAQ